MDHPTHMAEDRHTPEAIIASLFAGAAAVELGDFQLSLSGRGPFVQVALTLNLHGKSPKFPSPLHLGSRERQCAGETNMVHKSAERNSDRPVILAPGVDWGLRALVGVDEDVIRGWAYRSENGGGG